MEERGMSAGSRRIFEILYIALAALGAVTICSKCSFLYPFNDWMDINCFMTMGKGLLRGMIPYRDLMEQKGPALYFLSALAAWISPVSFTGFYLLEAAAAFFFLFYFRKTMLLLSGRASLVWLPLAALIVYSSGSFAHGGSAEELCLPFFAYALYTGIRILPDGGCMKKGEAFALGVTSALVLWIKYSMLGFYAGWILVPFYLAVKNGKLRSFLTGLLMIFLGVLTVSLPVLFWYYRKGALGDLLGVYFYNNIFIYTAKEGLAAKLRHLISGLHLTLVYLPLPFLVFVFGFLYEVRRHTEAAFLCLFCGILMGCLAFSGGQGILYYPLPLSALCVIGMAALQDLFEKRTGGRKEPGALPALALAACFLGMYLLSSNTYMMKYEKEDLPQFQFARIICREEDPTLLNYGFMDGGFYTASGITPEFRYFCRLNIELPEMLEGQDAYIDERIPLFVVTRNSRPDPAGYRLAAESSCFHEGRIQYYYLYRRNDCETDYHN